MDAMSELDLSPEEPRPHAAAIAKAAKSQAHVVLKSPPAVYAEQGLLQKEMQRRLDEVAKAAIDAELAKIQAEHPAAIALGATVQSRIFSKRPPGFTKVYTKLIEVVLWRSSAVLTQKAILDVVKAAFPPYAKYLNANVWTRPLQPADFSKMKRQISCGELAGKVSLTGVKSLSDFRKAVSAARSVVSSLNSYDVRFTFADDKIVVGKTPFATEIKSAAGKKYPSFRFTHNGTRYSLRVDALQALMEICEAKPVKQSHGAKSA